MASFHNWTGDELIDTQVPQFLNEDNAATQEKLDTKFNNSLKITVAADLNSFKDEGLYYCNSNSQAETILNCPTNYAFGLMVWGKEGIFYQEVREFNRGFNQDYNNCWRRSYYFDGGQGVWSNWQQMSYKATTLAGYGITDGMGKNTTNSVSVADILKRNINTSYLRLTGGNTFDKGATLQLCGGAYTANAGQFLLNAADSTQSATLLGNPSGLLKWKNKNIVRSINNIVADDNGNVSINVSGGGGSGSNITVDAELSDTSTNPIQNKAVKTAIDTVTASIPTKVSTLENDAGYLTQHQLLDNYAKTNQDNNFSVLQTFQSIRTAREDMPYQWNTTTPTSHCGFMIVSANTTIDLSKIFDSLPNDDYMAVYTCVIQSTSDYALTITGAGTVRYIGSASDCAVKAPGVLVNILCLKSGSNGEYSNAIVSVTPWS